jgi:hypothetical protein
LNLELSFIIEVNPAESREKLSYIHEHELSGVLSGKKLEKLHLKFYPHESRLCRMKRSENGYDDGQGLQRIVLKMIVYKIQFSKHKHTKTQRPCKI